jgi:hypothetical protein
MFAMSEIHASQAIKHCGTEQPALVGQILQAGPVSVELDNGQLRYLKVNGVEALRAIGFLVRDKNWGTYVPAVSGLKIDQGKDSFSVSYHATCKDAAQEVVFDISIKGHANGNIDFTGTARAVTDFLTARTGFVILHPLAGVVGEAVEVEHVDGKIERSQFPPLVNPVQPFLHVRSLTHTVLPGVRAKVSMHGDTWEMEDHRNWTDASFKTYVRPLALPWPYTLKAGAVVTQSVRLELLGSPPKAKSASGATAVAVRLGKTSNRAIPSLGLGVPAEEILPSLAAIKRVRLARPNYLVCHIDPRRGHGKSELYGYRVLADACQAEVYLEAVVASVDAYTKELQTLAVAVRDAGLKIAALTVVPAGDLKSVLPGGARPPAPELEALYAAARSAFPGVRLGGGMLSFFTELNRKRVPAQALDFVVNTTCPTVHAADDRSVLETLEALPHQVRTARSFIGTTAYRIGPSAIGCRDNPHGASYSANPNNERVCLAQMDPRQRGLLGAVWFLGYFATFAGTDVEAVSFGSPTGPLGFIYRRTDYSQPYFDAAGAGAVYPAFHVIAGLSRAAGAALVEVSSADPQLKCLAYRQGAATLLWLANAGTASKKVQISAPQAGKMIAGCLDETSFDRACQSPEDFQTEWRSLNNGEITLSAYAVAFICINDK